jgi:hypothetical protein
VGCSAVMGLYSFHLYSSRGLASRSRAILIAAIDLSRTLAEPFNDLPQTLRHRIRPYWAARQQRRACTEAGWSLLGVCLIAQDPGTRLPFRGAPVMPVSPGRTSPRQERHRHRARGRTGTAATRVQVGYFVRERIGKAGSAGTRASVAGVALEGGYSFRGGRIVSERTAAHVTSFQVDGQPKEAFSTGSSEHFALPRLRPRAAEAAGMPVQAPLTDVGVYLGWFGRATRLVQYGLALAGPAGRLPGAHRAADALGRRIQRTRTGVAASPTIRRTS